MKIVVDTNIIFSGLLNTQSRIGRMLLDQQEHMMMFTPSYMFEELERLSPKLLKITGITPEELHDLITILTRHIKMVDVFKIPEQVRHSADELVSGIDPKDAPFVALTNHLGALLWTGDLRLYNGLKAKGYNRVLTTLEVINRLNAD